MLTTADVDGRTLIPIRDFVGDVTGLPLDFTDALPAELNKVFLTNTLFQTAENGVRGSAVIVLSQELAFSIPGVDALQIVIGGGGGLSVFPIEVEIGSDPLSAFRIRLNEVLVGLRVSADVLRPLVPGTKEPDLEAEFLQITLGAIDVEFDSNGGLELKIGSTPAQVPPCMVGSTGVLLSIGKLRWLTPEMTETPPNTPARFNGLYLDDVTVEMPQLSASGVRMDDVFLGTGGFSGTVAWEDPTLGWNGTDFTGALHGDLLGFKGGLSKIAIQIRENALVGCEINADVFVPYLNKRVGLTLGLDGAGGFTATAALPRSKPPEAGVTPGETGYLVHIDVSNVLALDIATIYFQAPAGGVPLVGITGRVSPGTAGLNFPPVEFSGLSIDARGQVHIDGGWLNLPKRYTMTFHGFQLEIKKLGFGNTEDGGKWIGFSAGVKLVDGMPAGASVEGLRITWREGHPGPPEITLKGVRVNFEVPKTLKFSGEVSYDDIKQEFRGAIKLDLIALKMLVDGTAVFGVRDGQTYLAIYLAAEFPAGIPLFATGLGVYGMAGLFALNMEPNRQPSQPWYEISSPNDWYHNPAPAGVTNLSKWVNRNGSMAFGAGVTLGTVADNGHTFSGKVLLAIIFPGPIFLIQGSASILQERTKLDSEANFRALAVLDGRAGTLLMGLDALYRYDDTGALIDIHGAAEAFFNFNDPKAWHLNVGQNEPRERRLTARFFKLFDSYSYLMLDSQQLAMGAWIGFQQQWQFGPLGVALEAWIDGNARVSWKPAHFYGNLSLHGSARLSVFGFTAGLTVDASFTADVFDPFHVVGTFSVAIDLPWPFSDITVNIKLEWGPIPTAPPMPLPLKEVAIEHFKGTVSWPLPRVSRNGSAALLLPNYDDGQGFFKPLPPPPAPPPPLVPGNLDELPIVPLDSRPHITFGRNIHDLALVGVNAQPVIPEWEQIGDPVTKEGPARIKYMLEEIELQKLVNPSDPTNDVSWPTVARKGMTPNDPGVPTLYGSWAPMPQMPGGGGQNVGQVKLWLWSKTPFEYTRRTSRAWDEWFNDRFGNYPCGTVPDVCWDFEEIAPASGLPNPWIHPAEEGLTIGSARPGNISVVALSRPLQGFKHALCFSIPDRITIDLPQPAHVVRIRARDVTSVPAIFSGRDTSGQTFRADIATGASGPYFEIVGPNMVAIDIVYLASELPSRTLAQPVSGAMGCQYVPSRNHLVFVEFNAGRLSFVDLNTGQYTVLGTGYTKPTDIVVLADGNWALITEQAGNLLRVELTPGRANRSQAIVLQDSFDDLQQISLDEPRGSCYILVTATGRVWGADINIPVHAALYVDKLTKAVGVLMLFQQRIAYISEQVFGGRIIRCDLATGARETVIGNLSSLSFLRWGDAEHKSILVPSRDSGRVWRVHIPSGGGDLIIDKTPALPSSVDILPDKEIAVCSDTAVTAYRYEFCMLSICDIRSAMLIKHMNEELLRWSQAGEVLKPYTCYRLKIKTSISLRGSFSQDQSIIEYAYFRTDGPPGVAALTAPIGSEQIPPDQIPSDKFATGLEDLTRYVRRTVPRTPQPTPDNPLPARLLYRAYDIGVEFDENYVDLMYRLGRRDLTFQIVDGNGPVLDQLGRHLLLANPWGRVEEVTLTEHEERWLSMLTSTGCALLDPATVTRNTTLQASAEAHLFPVSALCEARLVPALLHEDFNYATGTGANGPSGSFGCWQVQDDTASPASRWEIAEEGSPADLVLKQIRENAATKLVLSDAADLPTDHSDQPRKWTDYRLSVFLRSGINTNGTIGVVFRYQDPAQHYKFVMDGQNKTRQLIRSGASNPLAQESFTYKANTDYLITVEAIGPSLRVCLNDEFVFAVTDSALSTGRIGLYCVGAQTAQFTDVRVDDLRLTAPVVYRFSFLTSRFKNFSDHLNSFEGKAWRTEVPPAANIAPLIGAAVPPGNPLTDNETRAYDALVMQLPATATAQPKSVVQVTRVEQNSQAIAFFVQSPEPLDWKRIDLQVLRADLPAQPPTSPAIPTSGVTPKAGVTPPNYTPIDFRILRKADGTGFFIVVPASSPPGSLLPPALYRFRLTYRRNNSAIDSDSEIFSEAGNKTAEQATLDIPWQTQL